MPERKRVAYLRNTAVIKFFAFLNYMTDYPLWQKSKVCIWTGRENFDPVRKMLREKYGLVDAAPSQLTTSYTVVWEPGRKLVYVDPAIKPGVWRADFRERTADAHGWPDDLISFGYWDLSNFPERIRTEDTMKPALMDAYRILKPTHVTLGFEVGEPVDLGALLGVK